jgi:hypothetical protein
LYKVIVQKIKKVFIMSKRKIEYLEPTKANLEKYNLDSSKVTINSDGSIDYSEDVDLSEKNLKEIPFKFNIVDGDFYCFYNQLTSLEGSPKKVGGGFWCQRNQLTTLEGAPKEVGGDFVCHNNKLMILEGSPKKVGGSFSCSYNQLTSLKGSPQEVGGNFWCRENQLTTLEGSPQEVGGVFGAIIIH